jgi:hypothetical protein
MLIEGFRCEFFSVSNGSSTLYLPVDGVEVESSVEQRIESVGLVSTGVDEDFPRLEWVVEDVVFSRVSMSRGRPI